MGAMERLNADSTPLHERHGASELHVILNFFEELKERVGNQLDIADG